MARTMAKSQRPAETQPSPKIPRPAPDPLRVRPGGERTLMDLQRAVGNQALQHRLHSAGALFAAGRAAHFERVLPVTPAIQSAIDARKTGGAPLSAGLEAEMEPFAGGRLDGARLHADPQSGLVAQSLGARAFTQGRDVFFAPGAFDPHSARGRALLAHELTHVAEGRTGNGGIQRDTAGQEIQSYVFAGDKKLATDADFARRSGRDMAARLRRAGKLTHELHIEANGMLAFFEGAAYDAYVAAVKPALLAVTIEPNIEMPAAPQIESYVFAGDKKLATDVAFARKSARQLAAKAPLGREVPREVRLELASMLAFFKGEAKDAYVEEFQRIRSQDIDMVPDERRVVAQDVDDISAWLLDHWYNASRFGIQNASLNEGSEAALWFLLATGGNMVWAASALLPGVGSLVLKGISTAATVGSRVLEKRFRDTEKKDVATFREVAAKDLSSAYQAIASQRPAINEALLRLYDKLHLMDRADPKQTEPRRKAAWEFTFRSGLDYNNPAALENNARTDVEAIWKHYLPCWRWYTKMENRALVCYYQALVDSGVAAKSSLVTKGFVPGEGKIYRFPSGATVYQRLKPGNFLVSEVNVP